MTRRNLFYLGSLAVITPALFYFAYEGSKRALGIESIHPIIRHNHYDSGWPVGNPKHDAGEVFNLGVESRTTTGDLTSVYCTVAFTTNRFGQSGLACFRSFPTHDDMEDYTRDQIFHIEW